MTPDTPQDILDFKAGLETIMQAIAELDTKIEQFRTDDQERHQELMQARRERDQLIVQAVDKFSAYAIALADMAAEMSSLASAIKELAGPGKKKFSWGRA